MPITDADRTIAGTSSQIAPSGFHAKPTIVVDLAHSPSAKSELVAKSCPPAFLFASSRAKAKGTDQKSDKMPDITASAGQPAVAAGWSMNSNALGSQRSATTHIATASAVAIQKEGADLVCR